MKGRITTASSILMAALAILVAMAGPADAACPSTCTEELRACGTASTGDRLPGSSGARSAVRVEMAGSVDYSTVFK